MQYCPHCTSPAEDDEKFCATCGNILPPTDHVTRRYANDSRPHDSTDLMDPEDIARHKSLAAIAYLIPFFPLLAEPNSRYVRYHVNQGFLLFFAFLISSLCVLAVCALLALIPVFGWLMLALLLMGHAVGFLVAFLLGISHAIRGKALGLPLIGKRRIIHEEPYYPNR